MKNAEKIKEEVEKTLNAFDNISNLDENPYLFTRLQAEIESGETSAKAKTTGEILRPAFLILFLMLNLFTVFYAFNQSNESNMSTTGKTNYSTLIYSQYSLNQSYYGTSSTTGK